MMPAAPATSAVPIPVLMATTPPDPTEIYAAHRTKVVPASFALGTSVTKELRLGPSSDAPMRARELLDEVLDLDHTAARLRNLLIEPKTPGEITTRRLSMQGFDVCCIILNVGFRSGETFADELLRLAPQ